MSDSFLPFERAMKELAKRMPGSPVREAILTRLMYHVNARLVEHFDDPLREYGLNQTTFTALGVLYGSPNYSLKPSELSVFMSSSRTNITRVADELVKKGLVERTPSELDRRQLDLTLTKKGMEFVKRNLPSRRKQHVDLWSAFTAREKASFEVLLRKLLAQLGG
ncbi:MAG TPA: MarR family transcriptional regulator [Rhodocyclaceae bacterium]|nr:MarR family transcriptional regulator [Rhodocyclaceae bacterium]